MSRNQDTPSAARKHPQRFRVWVTTRGKDSFAHVPRWWLIRAAFARKDVYL